MSRQSKIKELKEYFEKQDGILMAFLFGSRARKWPSKISDWDIACYFKPSSNIVEIESDRHYFSEDRTWSDLTAILQTDDVDLIVLNRAAANIAASAIKGIPLVIKDNGFYLEFMLRITQEAEDYRRTAREYAEIYWRSASLSEEDRDILSRRLIFLDSELKDSQKFLKLTQFEYEKDNAKRREVERWVENLINAAIDISKTVLASEKQKIPSSYKEILRNISLVTDFPKEMGEQLADWTGLRNILAHEYLDIRWKRIEMFIQKSQPLFGKLIEIVKIKTEIK